MFQFILTFLWKCNIYNKEENNLYNIEILTKINGGIILAIGDIIVGIDIGTSKVCTVVGEVNNFGQIETLCSTSC